MTMKAASCFNKMFCKISLSLLLKSLFFCCCLFVFPHLSQCGFLITLPRVVKSNSDVKVCILISNIATPVTLTLQLRNTDSASVLNEFQYELQDEKKCLPFHIPPEISASKALFMAFGTSRTSSKTFNGSVEVQVQHSTNLIFIETDKPVYKPGQTVQVRVLVLGSDLRPKLDELTETYIEDASNTRVMQWNNILLESGIALLTLPLSKEPKLGTWKITSKYDKHNYTRAFTVDEYVLPKFEVTVTTPAKIAGDTVQMPIKVCALYTYGEAVTGNLSVTVCNHVGGNKCSTYNATMKECHMQSFKLSAVQLQPNYRVYNEKLTINVTVTESGTNVAVNKSQVGPEVVSDEDTVKFDASMLSYYKPGLNYYGKIIATRYDGSPLVGQMVKVHVGVESPATYTYITDDNGHAKFTLLPGELRGTSIVLSPSLGNNPATSRHSIRSWYSPSGSYLQIQPPANAALVQCNKMLSLSVSYTTNYGSQTLFHYKVMSRGETIAEGTKQHNVEAHRTVVNVDDKRLPVISDRRHISPNFQQSRERHEDRVKSPPVAPVVSTVELSIAVTSEMSPVMQVLVYYVRGDSEMVADTIKLPVEHCFENKVVTKFTDFSKYPGERTTLSVSADPGSLCAVGVVDESVHLLGGQGQPTLDEALNKVRNFGLSEENNVFSQDCQPAESVSRSVTSSRSAFPFHLVRRHYSRSEYLDSSAAFKVAGLLVLTDLRVETRQCVPSQPPDSYLALAQGPSRSLHATARHPGPAGAPQRVDSRAVGSLSGDYDDENSLTPDMNAIEDNDVKQTLDLRHHFPETWLWQLVTVGARGQKDIPLEIPHTVTEWLASGFCVNNQSGLGVAAMSKLKAFQPFFISLSLPYSAIRGENISLPVKVFNYLDQCLVVRLKTVDSEGYRQHSGSSEVTVCVCGQQSVTHHFWLVPSKLGPVNVTVRAESVANEGVCDNKLLLSSQLGVKDAVTQELLVEAEGLEQEHTVSAFLCPNDGETLGETFNVSIPANIVADSFRAYLTVSGDLMGPALSGLDRLVRLPTGCGEQNMLNFAPNIFILQYLSHTNQLTPAISSKTLDYMRTGYQKELTYRHPDGAYSAFGTRDKEGSMWLTAFVVKSFSQASPFMFIDRADLNKSINWFKSKQTFNGCFPVVGLVIHKEMQGGQGHSGSGGSHQSAALTAFVLIAMLESGLPSNDIAVVKAARCLESQTQTVSDTYTLALMTYAFTLLDKNSNYRNNLLARMESLAITTGGMIHWETGVQTGQLKSVSVNIEMTAYMLLSYCANAGEAASKVPPIVRWLTTQRNANGGFSSTQDTVVALQALAKYASLVYRDDVDVTVKVRTTASSVQLHEFALSNENALLVQQLPISTTGSLIVDATGRGCALVQVNVRYNKEIMADLPTVDSTPAFQLNITANKTINTTGGRCQTITACARYQGPGPMSNMTILSVKMVTNWIPNKKTIQKLKNRSDLSKYEVSENTVNLYFEAVSKQHVICVSFDVESQSPVNGAKPGLATIYDYYHPELSVTKEYRILVDDDHPTALMKMVSKAEAMTVDGNSNMLPKPNLCPSCFDSVPSNVTDIFCSAKHAYKAFVVSATGRAQLRITGDYKTDGFFAYITGRALTVPAGCQCDLLVPKAAEARLFIFTNQTLAAGATLMGDGSSVVKVGFHLALEPRFRMAKRRQCRLAGR